MTITGGSSEAMKGIEDEDLDGDVSDDDMVEEGGKVTWFGMGMMREEKIVSRRPWRNSLIIKLVGRTLGY